MGNARLNTLWARLIIEELHRGGVDYFCLSPGSRCTPLTAAVGRHSDVEHVMHFDERGAAFHALGYARATGRPAALVCTSGTAAANYLPAVVEASMDGVPLVLLTADRPPELRDTGANQTICQPGIYGEYVRWEIDMPCPSEDIDTAFVLTTVDQAVYRARYSQPGPVHLNCMFREPFLIDTDSEEDVMPGGAIDEWSKNDQPYTTYAPARSIPTPDSLRELVDTLNGAKSGLLIVGRCRNRLEIEAARELARRLNWPVFADIASGLRMGSDLANVIPHYDYVLQTNVLDSHGPFTCLQVGRTPTSKRLAQFLAGDTVEKHIVFADHPHRQDPGHRVSMRFEGDLGASVEALIPLLEPVPETNFLTALKKLSAECSRVIDRAPGTDARLSEPVCARTVSRQIGAGDGLWLASSMPIRDMDLFAAADGNPVVVGCNRGASGIDGAIASASGFAAGLKRPVTLIIGDLAFLHDLNSLALLRSLRQKMTIVVINNDGGGIFSFLPVAAHTDIFEPMFGTPHGIPIEKAAEMFDLWYANPSTIDEFGDACAGARNVDGSTILEIHTDRDENFKLHRAIEQEVVAALNEL